MGNVRLDNITKSVPDDRDYLYIPSTDALPDFIDLKPGVFEIDSQLSVGSCTANATTSACEYILNKEGKAVSLSRLFTYYDTRNVIEDRAGQEGASTRDAIRSLFHTGTCLESLWPYDETKVDTAPSPEAYNAVGSYKVGRYESIAMGGNGVVSMYTDRGVITHAVKSAIADGIPVVFSILVGEQIRNLTGPWQTHRMDSVYSGKNASLGGHAILIIGYSDEHQKFLVENSWGTQWGDGGFFGLDYSVFESDAMEAFIIRSFAGVSSCDVFHTEKQSTPMSIGEVGLIESYVEDIATQVSYSDLVKVDISGGLPPYNITWTNLFFDKAKLSEDTFKFSYWWDKGTIVDAMTTLTVSDSSYPTQQVVRVDVPLHFVRGSVKPVVDPVVPPVVEPIAPVPAEQPKQGDNGNVIGAIIGVVLLVVAIAYLVMM